MTVPDVPALPAEGSEDWYDHYAGLDATARALKTAAGSYATKDELSAVGGVGTGRNALTGFFHVIGYGAAGNSNGTAGNGTDDAAAFTQAIADASAAGGTVFVGALPPGKFYRLVLDALPITASGVHLVGAGAEQSKLFFDTADPNAYGRVIFDGGASTGTISDVGIRDVAITNRPGLVVSQPAPTGGYDGNGCGLTFRGCKTFTAERVDQSRAANYGIVAIRSTDGRIEGCHVHDNTADGIHVMRGSARVLVNGNLIHDTGDDAIAVAHDKADQGTTTDVIISDNLIYNTGARGVGIMAPCKRITVADNTILGTYLPGIGVDAMEYYGGSGYGAGDITDVLISGNTVDQAGNFVATTFRASGLPAYGIVARTTSYKITNLAIQGNVITRPRNGYVYASNSSGGTIEKVTVSDNIGYGSPTYGVGPTPPGASAGSTPLTRQPGIWLNACRDIDVADNQLADCWYEGVLIDGTTTGTVRIRGNTTRNANMLLNADVYAYRSTTPSFVADNMVPNGSGLAGVVAPGVTHTVLRDNVGSVVPPGDPGIARATGAVLAADTFNRANSSPLGTASDGGTWTDVVGVSRVNGNKAGYQSFVSDTQNYFTRTTSTADRDLLVTMPTTHNPVMMCADATGGVIIAETALFTYTATPPAFTKIGADFTDSLVPGDAIEIRKRGNNFHIYRVPGGTGTPVFIATRTTSFNSTVGKDGIGNYRTASNAATVYEWDDFQVRAAV